MEILHFVPRINYGGGTQSIVNEVTYQRRLGEDHRHSVVSLEANNATAMVLRLVKNRIRPIIAPTPTKELADALQRADLVILHYWLCPAIRKFLTYIDGIPLRLLVYARINGLTLPQKICAEIIDSADHVILTNPRSTKLIQAPQRCTVVPSIIDGEQFTASNRGALPHTPYKMLYVGTVNAFKMRRDFVDLHANLLDEPYQVDVYGSGGGEQALEQERAAKNAAQIMLRGFCENIHQKYQDYHTFVYPIARYSYASSDKTLEEALWSGCAPVMFDDGPLAAFVDHGRTGFLAKSPQEYRGYLRRLAGDPALRQQLGDNARQAAQQDLHPAANTQKLLRVYRDTMALPKAPRVFPRRSAGEFFLASLFPNIRSAAEFDPRMQLANQEEMEFFLACEGGLYQFYNEHKSDEILRHLLETTTELQRGDRTPCIAASIDDADRLAGSGIVRKPL